MEGTNRRRRLGEQAWRKLLQRFAAGDQSVGDFCLAQQVSLSSFNRWRARLGGAGAGLASATPAIKPSKTTVSNFVDLGALRTSAPVGSGRLEFKLDLGGGVTLHVVRG